MDSFNLLIRLWPGCGLSFWRRREAEAAGKLRSWFIAFVDLVSFAGQISSHNALINLVCAVCDYIHLLVLECFAVKFIV